MQRCQLSVNLRTACKFECFPESYWYVCKVLILFLKHGKAFLPPPPCLKNKEKTLINITEVMTYPFLRRRNQRNSFGEPMYWLLLAFSSPGDTTALCTSKARASPSLVPPMGISAGAKICQQ